MIRQSNATKVVPAIVLVLVAGVGAGCKKSGPPPVPAEYKDVVPTKGLSTVVPVKADASINQPGGATLMYADATSDGLRDAFKERFTSRTGFEVLVECGAPEGFNLTAVKAPDQFLIAMGGRVADDHSRYRVIFESVVLRDFTLPDDPSCAWGPTAPSLCDFSKDPRVCVLKKAS